MPSLGQVIAAIENHRGSGSDQVKKARPDRKFGDGVLKKWREAKDKIGVTVTPTGLRLPRLALPDLDEAGEIARFLWDEGLPGEFPFLTSAFAEQYLDSASAERSANCKQRKRCKTGREE